MCSRDPFANSSCLETYASDISTVTIASMVWSCPDDMEVGMSECVRHGASALRRFKEEAVLAHVLRSPPALEVVK